MAGSRAGALFEGRLADACEPGCALAADLQKLQMQGEVVGFTGLSWQTDYPRGCKGVLTNRLKFGYVARSGNANLFSDRSSVSHTRFGQ
jgi:hypothetical protein